MNAIPTLTPQIDRWAERDRLDDNCCDLCASVPVAEVIDGDRMCWDCADKWARNEQPDDDLLPLDHPAMQQAIAQYNEVVRLSDERLLELAKGQRRYVRENRK